MDKAKKKNVKRAVALVVALVVVGMLAAMPLIAKQAPEAQGPQASILSGTAEIGDIRTQLIGGGTLASEEAVVIDLPSEVKLKSFLVSNGDTVTAGAPIASVDRVTVMTAITRVQDTLEALAEQIEEAADTDSEETLTALAGGTVKLLYAREGASVQSIMLEHGALAVLSLDGLMAVELETEADLPVGTVVNITFEDGTTKNGKIEKNLAGQMTVTLEDKDYGVDAPVVVTAEDGTAIGSGTLYIYSPWNATAYTGTVDKVKISEGDKLDAGDAMMVLTDVGHSAAYQQLISRRQAYEELMLELFQMYQTETVTAPCDGVVSGVDEESLQLLSAKGSYTLSFLANSPNGDDESLYSNYVAQIATLAENGWVLKVNPQAIPIADYRELSTLDTDPTKMTQTVLHTQSQIPVYTLENGQWVQVESTALKAGDTLLFAAAGQGRFVWCVLLSTDTPGNTATPDTPERPGGSQQPELPTEPEPTVPSESPEQTERPSQPGNQTAPDFPGSTLPGSSWGGTIPDGNWGSIGTGPQGGMTQPEEELYGLDLTQIAAITPQTAMTLDITVDEQDITALRVGMEARLRIDALGGQKYDAQITDIGNTGTNNGGSSKFTVTLSVDRGENMLSGMTATATVELATTGPVLTVPADALVEQGNQTLIYTGYDEENGTLLNPVEVKAGASDGQSVEILEGLTQGQTYYYAYYDTLEISFTPDFGSGSFFGR